VAATYKEILASNIPERADAIAGEIQQQHPDLVSLQKVTTLMSGPPSGPATTVAADQLQALTAALELRGLHYAPVEVQQNADLEFPAYDPFSNTSFEARGIDFDVVLARTDLPVSEFKLEQVTKQDVTATLEFHDAGTIWLVNKGWRGLESALRMSGAEILEAQGLGLRVRRDVSGSNSEVGRAQVEAAKRGNGGPAHIHLLQEERFIVHTGALLVRRGRERLRVGAGDDVCIPPRVVHTFKAEAQSTFTVEFRPPLRVWEFFRDLFALPTDQRGYPRIGDLACLLRVYSDEFPLFPLHSSTISEGTGRAAVQARICSPLTRQKAEPYPNQLPSRL